MSMTGTTWKQMGAKIQELHLDKLSRKVSYWDPPTKGTSLPMKGTSIQKYINCGQALCPMHQEGSF